MRVLVIGGAGRTGTHIVDKVAARGDSVRVLSRHPDSLPDGVEASAGDITRPDSVAEAASGMDAVVIVVESALSGGGSNSPDAVHDQGTRHVIDPLDGASAQVVMVSQIYITRPDAFPQGATVIEARGKGEQALRESGVAFTIVRPSWLTDEPGGQALRLGQGDDGDGTVSREDVAEAVVQAISHREARGKTFELYGEPGTPPEDWAGTFAALKPDG